MVLNSNHHVVDLVYEVITIKGGLVPAEELETQRASSRGKEGEK